MSFGYWECKANKEKCLQNCHIYFSVGSVSKNYVIQRPICLIVIIVFQGHGVQAVHDDLLVQMPDIDHSYYWDPTWLCLKVLMQ